MNDRAVEEFLQSRGFCVEPAGAADLLAEFDRQMDAGLAGRGGSLAMIPAYLGIDRPVPTGTPVLVMDAGGTNLRAAVVWFDTQGRPRIEDFRKCPMPGTEGVEVDAERFFDALADVLEPIARRATALGLCFSYPTEILPDGDGKLLRWTKQIQAGPVVGRRVGSSLVRALEARIGRSTRVRVLNDTVATLLAGKSAGVVRRYSNYIGFILGTGTNTACVERHERIGKLPGLAPGGLMAINVESGNFDGVVRSGFDEDLDRELPDCGSYRFEKMISGAYLGRLGLCILRAASAQGLFSPSAASALASLGELPNKDFDDTVDNPFLEGTVFGAVPLGDADRRRLIALGRPVFLRAAYLTAVNIAAAVLRSGSGRDPLHPVCVTVDGSTYYRTRTAQFKSRVEAHLRELLGSRGVHYELLAVEDAPIVGAAVAGLSAAGD